MTKKDYELIAEGLRHGKPSRTINPYNMESNEEYKVGKAHAWDNACKTLADFLQLNDTKFNKQKFLALCGIEV